MKTPRELILQRDAGTVSRLEQIRAEVLADATRAATAALRRQTGMPSRHRAFWSKFRAECLTPWRHVWIGIGAAWAVIFVLTLTTEPPPRAALADEPPPSPEIRMILREQRQLMAQLLESDQPPAAARPKTPGPRSQWTPSGSFRGADIKPAALPSAQPALNA